MNAALAVAHTDKYLGHIIANDLSDESDMEEKVRCIYIMPGVMAYQKFLFLF